MQLQFVSFYYLLSSFVHPDLSELPFISISIAIASQPIIHVADLLQPDQLLGGLLEL